MVKCPKCNKPIEKDSMFCNKCGYKIYKPDHGYFYLFGFISILAGFLISLTIVGLIIGIPLIIIGILLIVKQRMLDKERVINENKNIKHSTNQSINKNKTVFNEPIKKHITIKTKGIYIILLVIAILLIISSIVIFTVPMSYSSTEHYKEREAYTANECNNQQGIFKIGWKDGGYTTSCLQQDCASYETYCSKTNWYGGCITYSQRCSGYKCIKYQMNCIITIENKEKQGMTINLELQRNNYDNKIVEVIKSDSVYVNPLDQMDYNWDFTYSSTERVGCQYNYNGGLISVCNNIIRYNDVEKTRPATKTATLYQLWTNQVKYDYWV